MRLSRKHEADVVVGSGIDPAVVAERGYETVKSRAELPDFKQYQRRAPALRVPMYSPDGITRSAQLRPDNPRTSKKGKAIKYETAGGSECILDVHPRMREEARTGSGALWITEGIKKADSLTSRGLCTVGLIGVWNWQRGGEMLACWDHIRLEGRRVYIVFDSDVMEKESVQLALSRLVSALEGRGAEVLVVYLPAGEEAGKVGVDDYLVAGGTVNELKMLARKFEPEDFGRVRLSRDEELAGLVEDECSDWRERDWMHFVGAPKPDANGELRANWARGHTARDVKHALNKLAARRGKVAGGVVEVEAGLRLLAELSAKSIPSVRKALSHLEADGQIEPLPPTEEGNPRRYQLFAGRARVAHTGERNAGEEKATSRERERYRGVKGLRAPSAPRLRWSSPGRRRRAFEVVPGRVVVRSTGAPPEREESGYVKRLGPHRGAVLDALEAAGGEMDLLDLCAALHRRRPRDVRRRILQPLAAAGIIEMDGENVRLKDDWIAALDKRREEDGEIEQAARQRKNHAEQGKRWREHLERVRRGTPAASLEAVRRTRELRDKRTREMREERERDEAPTPPAVRAFVEEMMQRNPRLRMGLMCAIARDKGLRWRDVPPAVRRMGYRVERLAEYDDAEFVFSESRAA